LLSKRCGLGPVGFPAKLPERRRLGRFHLKLCQRRHRALN